MAEQIRLLNDPVLRKVCSSVNPLDMIFIDGLLAAMSETMKAENGVGLAANQVGVSVRVFILKDGESFKEFINPEVVAAALPVEFEGEACLSIPGTSAVTERFSYIKLKWIDRSWVEHEAEFKDIQAFAVQHEMDHLNGKLYIDQLKPMRRNMVVSKHKKYLQSLRRN